MSMTFKYHNMVTDEGSCYVRQFLGGSFLPGDQDLVNTEHSI